MSDFDWKKVISSVAPTLATALGGPLAGMAVKTIATALTGNENASEQQFVEALQNASPEDLLKLKQVDNEFKLKLKELDIKLEDIAYKDRDSARQMQIAVKSWVVPTLASITIVGFFVVVMWILTGKVALDNTLLGVVLGHVSSKAEQVYNFFFGSSLGSKEKTSLLNRKD